MSWEDFVSFSMVEGLGVWWGFEGLKAINFNGIRVAKVILKLDHNQIKRLNTPESKHHLSYV